MTTFGLRARHGRVGRILKRSKTAPRAPKQGEDGMLKFATITAALFCLMSSPAGAEMNGTIRIGVLNDMSSVYAAFQGPGSVVAAQLAVEDFAKHSKRKVEILSADHQNKPDIGAAIARQWFDVDGVDMIIDVPNSAVALAVADIAREKNKVLSDRAPARHY